MPGRCAGCISSAPPHRKPSYVRCVTGALYDVIVDIRPDSPTHLQSFGVELTAENGRALYVPKGFAHGFLTLLPDTTASYMVDEFYTPDAEGGLRYDDPALGLDWPGEVHVISPKDAAWPLLET
jgi:dTDP-4-dehydrorhamnose 3,5-epimerase